MARWARTAVGVVAALALAASSGCVTTPAPEPTVSARGRGDTARPGSTPGGGRPAPPSGSAGGDTGGLRVEFSNPWSSEQSAQYRLHETQVAAIRAAPRGATIHLVTYTLATASAGRALLDAHRRGVNVRIIIDDHEDYRWTKRLQRALGTDQRRRSYVVRCHLACASDITYPRRRSRGTIRSYVHAKWLSIDRTGGDTDVVMIPSENLTPAAVEQSNDMLVLRGNRAVYDFLRSRFDIMRKDAGTSSGTVTAGVVSLTMFPMPLPHGYRIDPRSPLPASMDPYLDYLRHVQCRGPHRTAIRIAMYMWTYPRLAVARRIAQLAREGCPVLAIGQPLSAEGDEGWDPEITRVLLFGGVDLHQTTGKGVYLHSKILTLEGWDTGNRPLTLSVTGSSNLLLQALVASDDLVVSTTDPAVTRAYSHHVEDLVAHHSRPVG